jgi:hypothetical protein
MERMAPINEQGSVAHHVRSALLFLFVVLPFTLPPALSQNSTSQLPTGEEILAHVDAGLAGIDDYVVSLTVTVNLERLKVPQMQATMYFKKPDKIHFDAESFAMLPREGVAFNVKKLLARYSVERVENQADTSFTGFRITLAPKSERIRMRKIVLSVRPGRWTVERFNSSLPDGRTMTASFSYEEIDGHRLPAELQVVFSSDEHDSTETAIADQISPGRRPGNPQTGTITIRYSDYKINTGLSDDIFDKK